MSAHLVLGGCGHWWRESYPDDLVFRDGDLRVCTQCRPGDPGVVEPSPQGLGMVTAMYVEEPL